MKDLSVTQKRCLELARIIREGLPGVRFDMCTWGHCGTAGCIGGYAVAVYGKDNTADGIKRSAAKLLGVTEHQAGQLFYADDAPVALSDITPEMAGATLENFALTGEVVWK